MNNRIYIVGIGASAGGLESMAKLLANLKPGGNAVYIVAQHMAKDGHIERVLRLLNLNSAVPVREARSNDLLKPDQIFLLPPGSSGVVHQGRVQLLPVTSDQLSSPSINALFNSIAQEFGESSVGIVLSGTGSDGVAGCRAIKALGGQVIVQSPESASFSGMPMAVMRAKAADESLAPEDIARLLNTRFSLAEAPLAPRPVPAPATPAIAASPSLATLLKAIFDATGVDFSSYKEETLLRRIERRMATLNAGIASLEHYLAYTRQHPEELKVLQHYFLVSLSSFFRDRKAFDMVGTHLAELVTHKTPGDAIRIWVPGCATGEECYTFAILLAEILGNRFGQFDISIIGSDLNPDALKIARNGIYRQTAFKETDPGILEHYFECKDQHYLVSPGLRIVCHFLQEDVINALPPENLDMISCRNLFIYMKGELQKALFRKLHQALLPGALLFLGQSENLGMLGNALFMPVDHFHRLYRRKELSYLPSGRT